MRPPKTPPKPTTLVPDMDQALRNLANGIWLTSPNSTNGART